jgi:hypothetical protein
MTRSRSCSQRQTTTKYRSRPSPPYPANECAQGTKKRGNDGNLYVVKLDRRGIGRWVRHRGSSSRSRSKPRRRSGREVERVRRSRSKRRSSSRPTKSRSKRLRSKRLRSKRLRSNNPVRTRLPAKVTFDNPPFGSVTIRAGDMGYTQTGSVRLRRDKDGKISFPTKVAGVTYVEASPGSRIFLRHARK